MLEESLLKGMLPVSTKRAVISLIFKKGDKTLLKNYRPISLTNYDYKILTFILAKRIQSVISKLISQSINQSVVQVLNLCNNLKNNVVTLKVVILDKMHV